MHEMRRVCVIGSHGFIGHHIVSRLIRDGRTVRTYDLKQGRDAHNLLDLQRAMEGFETVIHLASNADIAAAAKNPMIDFTEGTVLTQNVVECARRAGVSTIIYASGSGVYGEPVNGRPFTEDDVFRPVSPYGASKIAGEALVSSYCHMFGMRGLAFRFANVVGPGQTHGVGYDFIRKLRANPDELEILGDGSQTKSYIAVTDVIEAVFLAAERVDSPFEVFNVSTEDSLTVLEIAQMAADAMGLRPSFRLGSSNRGWPGDVPVIALNSDKIRSLGWSNQLTTCEAMAWALDSMQRWDEDAVPGEHVLCMADAV